MIIKFLHVHAKVEVCLWLSCFCIVTSFFVTVEFNSNVLEMNSRFVETSKAAKPEDEIDNPARNTAVKLFTGADAKSEQVN